MEKKEKHFATLPTSTTTIHVRTTRQRLILNQRNFVLVSLSILGILLVQFYPPLRSLSSDLYTPRNPFNTEFPRVISHNHDDNDDPSSTATTTTRWNHDVAGEGPRIAIIGAGAGGSSAAYFLKHFSNLTSRDLSTLVTIYEQEDYVGGRSTVVWPWEQDPYLPPRPRTDEEEEEEEPVELGASIFVEANKNLQKAVKEFGLETTQYGQGEQQDGGETGVWDGERFVFKQSRFGWWDKTKLFFRYGRSPFKVKKLVESTLNSFVSLYSRLFITSPNFPFDSYLNLSIALELLPSASQTGSEYFKDRSISPLFTYELVSSATQVNYGQSIEEIHGLGALVSLAAQGAVSVKGGNRKILEEFVVRSEANLRLGTKVKEIVKLDDGSESSSSSSSSTRSKWIVKTQDGQNSGVYDAIILAAPFHESFISIPQLASQSIPPRQPYVDLHVTLILTNASSPLSSHFSLSPKSKTPNSIFSTFTTSSTSKPKFNSLNYLKLLGPKLSAKFDPYNAAENNNNTAGAKVHVVKIFSKNELTEIELQGMFGLKNVLKVFKKQWKSYPYLEPIQQQTSLAQIRLDEKGIYYVNGMERLISTMETETVSAYNVVSLIMKDFFGYKPPLSWAEWGQRRKPT